METSRSRRRFLGAALSLALAGMSGAALAAGPTVEVWKSPSCGCCADWVKHLEANGFKVKVNETGNNAVRARLGIPAELGGCHSAKVGNYAIEGHVPAADIKRLLAQKPAAVGLAVPGMPIGSPGMEQGDRKDPYDVLLVNRDGSTRVFNSYK